MSRGEKQRMLKIWSTHQFRIQDPLHRRQQSAIFCYRTDGQHIFQSDAMENYEIGKKNYGMIEISLFVQKKHQKRQSIWSMFFFAKVCWHILGIWKAF